MRILITGGAGFLGSNLASRLIADNHSDEVIIADNLSSGNLDNLSTIKDKIIFIDHDVREPFSVKKFGRVDQIYNLASPASPEDYYREPLFTLETSALGIKNALEFAKVNKAKLMHSSTSEVYGDPAVHPQVESYWGNVNPIGPRSCYDEAKRYSESYLTTFRRMYQTDAKIVRIFNTYGPNMRPNDGRVVSNFIISALTGKPLTVYGDGGQTRSFCYVDDLINGFIKMMASSEIGPVNLGNPSEMTIKEIAEKIIALTESQSKIIYKALPENDPTRRQPDITLAKKTLDWQPNISLDDGLAKTIKYFRGRLESAVL